MQRRQTNENDTVSNGIDSPSTSSVHCDAEVEQHILEPTQEYFFINIVKGREEKRRKRAFGFIYLMPRRGAHVRIHSNTLVAFSGGSHSCEQRQSLLVLYRGRTCLKFLSLFSSFLPQVFVLWKSGRTCPPTCFEATFCHSQHFYVRRWKMRLTLCSWLLLTALVLWEYAAANGTCVTERGGNVVRNRSSVIFPFQIYTRLG